MSLFRRLRQQARQQYVVSRALRQYRLYVWRARAQWLALWFLTSHRGYGPEDRLTTEVDLAALGLLRWARSSGEAPPWRFILAQVRWAK